MPCVHGKRPNQEVRCSIPYLPARFAREVPVAASFRGTHKGNQGIWRPARVSAILSSPTYMGHYRPLNQQRPPSSLAVPAIISAETWRQAEVLRNRNQALALRNSKRRYLLRGLIRCEHCRLPYVGNSAGGGRYHYYVCMGNRALTAPCRAARMRADRVEDLVWADIEGFIRDPGPVIMQLEAQLTSERDQDRPVERELAELEAELTKKRADRQRVINLYRRGLIDDAEVEKELTGLEREVALLNDRRSQLLAQVYTRQEFKTQSTTARLLLEQLRDQLADITWEGKRDLVQALVESISVATLVEADKRVPQVTIRYRFGGGHMGGSGTDGGKKSSHCYSAPLGPSKPKNSPSCTSKLTSSKARIRLGLLRFPNRFAIKSNH